MYESLRSSRQQVVPEINNPEDEANIQRIALSLSNPSPREAAGKSFEFEPAPFMQSPRWSTGIFSPNFPNVFSFMASQTPQPSHYPALSAAGAMNPSPFVAPMAPVTPQSSLVAIPHPHHPVDPQKQSPPQQQSQQHQQSPPHQQQQQPSVVPVNVNMNVKKEEPKVEEPVESNAEMADTDPEDEYNDQQDQVPYTSDSEASYTEERPAKQARRKRKASHSVATTARSFADLTDEQIAFMDFKELTRLMTAAGLSRTAIAETKARRRRLKNRQSARLCSNKKRELCAELASDKSRLSDQLSQIQSAYQKLQKEHSNLRQQYDALLQSTKRARE